MTKSPIVGFAVLATLFAPQLLSAKITRNTIDPVAVVTTNGRRVVVSGPLECTAGERAYLSVMVSQRTTGAIANARTFVVCTGAEKRWDIDAAVIGDQRFEPGPALAVAVVQTIDRGTATDAHQWLVPVTLIAE